MVLSCGNRDHLIGNFMGDILSFKEQKVLRSQIYDGIELHRLIDSYTDAHPEVKKATKLLSTNHGKYATVVADVLFDYFLFINWNEFMSTPFELFERECYDMLIEGLSEFPDRYHSKIKRMIESRFLSSCNSYEAIHRTFSFINRRAKFDNNFDIAVEDLKFYEKELNVIFLNFFPDIIREVTSFCDC